MKTRKSVKPLKSPAEGGWKASLLRLLSYLLFLPGLCVALLLFPLVGQLLMLSGVLLRVVSIGVEAGWHYTHDIQYPRT